MRMNNTNKGVNKTVNKSGHSAYKLNPKEKLVTQVLTTFFNEPKYYGDNSDDIIDQSKFIAKKDPKFISNLARYARKEMHLRTISHVLSAIVAHEVSSKPYIRETVNDVVERPDDITEIIGAYKNLFGNDKNTSLPNGLKKAIANSFGKFNEYQLSKYNSQDRAIKLADAIKLTHPPRNDLYKRVIENTLAPAERWERELSMHGNNKESWEKLIDNNQLGYMATLRNLRNILSVGLDDDRLNKVYSFLSDPERVAKSKQLPFRFYSAYREVGNYSSKVTNCLEKALRESTKNVPFLKGKTLVAIDVSGSMDMGISSRSNVRCCDIACILGTIASHICEDSIVTTFDTRLYVETLSSYGSILEQTQKLCRNGGGTDIGLPFKYLIDNSIYVDRVILLSDNEVNHTWSTSYRDTPIQSLINQYREKVNNNCWIHAIDLCGYGTTQFVGRNTNIITGWSERCLEFVNMVENGMDNLVKVIENYP